MTIQNKRSLITGVITIILAVTCLIIYLLEQEQRFFIAMLILIVYAMINFIIAFSKKGTVEEIINNSDERDLYVAMKSSHLLIKIMNYTICTFTFIFIIAYAMWKNQYFIVIASTLCIVLVLMFIFYLIINIYFEKHE